MKTFIKNIYRLITSRLDDLMLLAGVASICFGLWQIYPPAAWIFCGAALIFIALASAKTKAKQP